MWDGDDAEKVGVVKMGDVNLSSKGTSTVSLNLLLQLKVFLLHSAMLPVPQCAHQQPAQRELFASPALAWCASALPRSLPSLTPTFSFTLLLTPIHHNLAKQHTDQRSFCGISLAHKQQPSHLVFLPYFIMFITSLYSCVFLASKTHKDFALVQSRTN